MQQKRNVVIGGIILAVIVIVGFLYSQFSAQAPEQDPTIGNEAALERITAERAKTATDASAVPATPDATVDAILDDAASDDQALQSEVTNEQDAVTASGDTINTLSQTYDETQL